MATNITVLELIDYLDGKGLVVTSDDEIKRTLAIQDINIDDNLSIHNEDDIFYYDEAETIGEEIDDQVRSRIGYKNPDLLIEGGYNIITDDPNFEEVETLEIYYSIKKE